MSGRTDAVSPDALLTDVLARYPGTVEVRTWGERSVFVGPGGALLRGVYALTV